jgi:hypothetical protein
VGTPAWVWRQPALWRGGRDGSCAARTQEKARTALTGIPVEIETLELIDPASIDAFADSFLDSGRPCIFSSTTPASWLRRFNAMLWLRIPTRHESPGTLPVGGSALAGFETSREGARRLRSSSAIASEASTLTTRTTNGAPTTSGRRTVSQRQPTRYSPLPWTSAVKRTAFAPSLYTPAESIPI